jgi:hypothetical protein
MNTYIDPLTGRMMMRGPGGAFPLPDATDRPMVGDLAARMGAMRQAQASGRYGEQLNAPASPRPFMGPGDGAPMFEDNPTAPAPTAPNPTLGVIENFGAPPATPVPADGPAAGSMANEQPLPVPPIPPQAPNAPRAAAPAPQAAPQQPQGALMGPTVRPPMAEDEIEAFSTRMGASESGNRFEVMNPGGYVGRTQFGAPRLQTLGVYTPGRGEDMRGWGAGGGTRMAPGAWTGTFNVPGHPEVRTIEDFRRNPAAQRAVERAHWADIDANIDSLPGAENFDRNGLRAVAQLGGNGGLRRFVESGGQFNAADGNGTTLQTYYRRYAGSDAPPGLAGRMGGPGAAPSPDATPTAQGGEQAAKPPAAAPNDAAPVDQATPNFMGVPAGALLSAGSALIGGRTPAEGLSRAGQAFVSQANTDRQFEQGRSDRAEARADRRTTQAQTEAYRRAQLAIQQQRVDQAGTRRDANNGNVQSSAIVQDPQTGTSYRTTVTRDNQMRVTTLDGQPVEDAAVVGRLRQGSEPGAAAESRDMVEQRNAVFEAGSSARGLRTSIANVREVLRQDPSITGPDWPTRGINAVVESLGIPVGQRTPENIAMVRQALQTGNMQTLMQIAPALRPMSNVDLQAIAQMSPSLLTHPRILNQWLDQMDRAASRAERNAFDLGRQLEDPNTARAIMRAGGIAAWRARREAEETERDRAATGGQPAPSIQPGNNAQGQREWQPIRPGERRQAPGGIVIERVN